MHELIRDHKTVGSLHRSAHLAQRRPGNHDHKVLSLGVDGADIYNTAGGRVEQHRPVSTEAQGADSELFHDRQNPASRAAGCEHQLHPGGVETRDGAPEAEGDALGIVKKSPIQVCGHKPWWCGAQPRQRHFFFACLRAFSSCSISCARSSVGAVPPRRAGIQYWPFSIGPKSRS